MSTFSYRVLPQRPDFSNTLDSDERAAMAAHFAYLQRLQSESRLVFVGRTEEGEYGIVVFEAADIDEARALATNDPAVLQGVVNVEVHAFVVIPMGLAAE